MADALDLVWLPDGTANGSIKSHLKGIYGEQCYYCERPIPLKQLTIDHVIPKALDGGHEATNLRLACNDCQMSKNSYSPMEWSRRIEVKIKRLRLKVRREQQLLKRLAALELNREESK